MVRGTLRSTLDVYKDLCGLQHGEHHVSSVVWLRVCCVACYLIGHEVNYRQPQDRKRREQHAEDPANLHELPLRRILTQVAVVEIEAEDGRGCGEDWNHGTTCRRRRLVWRG